jgi:hypothetical protein
MASFSLIRLRKVRDNIVHESLLILIRRLPISNIARAEYRMLISEIYPIDNTLGNLARERVIIEEHIESFSDCGRRSNVMGKLFLHDYISGSFMRGNTF